MTLNPEHHREERSASFKERTFPKAQADNVLQFPNIQEDEESAETTEEPEALEVEYLSETTLTTDPVRDYLRQMSRYELLSAAEEVELSRAIEAGLFARERIDLEAYNSETERRELATLVHQGEASKDRMINSNLRLVVSIAKKYYGRGLPFLDVIQEGNKGLIRAVEKFDYTQGNKFSTYATWWIRQSIQRSFADQSMEIRLPVHTWEKVKLVTRTRQSLLTLLNREPTDEEIAEEIGTIDAAKVAELLEINRKTTTVSLNTPVDATGEDEYGDFIADDAPSVHDQVEETVTQDKGREFIEKMLTTLSEREALIVRLRFGLGREAIGMKLEEVGQELGLTRERIRQIEGNALRKMQRYVVRNGLGDQSQLYLDQ